MMMKHLWSAILVFCGFLMVSDVANAASAVPEPFRGFDDTSKYTIRYDDLTALLEIVVADVGRSDRTKAARNDAKTGTRVRAKVNRSTINEGNRFFFETFVDDEGGQQKLSYIQKSLEEVTTEMPLENFSRDEQLAYWLNLYNVTVLNEIVKIYPQRDLKKFLYGKKSILAKKMLTVEGVSLSLDDIQFTILAQNYNHNPLIIYGLYQGIIGGPNIRQSAYTGADVYPALTDNAFRFINSNRGTAIKSSKSFRVSSFYDRNRAYFPNYNADLTAHLLAYLEGNERLALQQATTLKSNINDWTVTDLGGSRRVIGGSLADSSAALMGSVSGGASSNYGATASAGTSVSGIAGGYNSALLRKAQEASTDHESSETKDGTVTVEDLEEDAVEADAASESSETN